MKNMYNLTGKKAVVTGGGSGIGKAIAIGLASQGAEVCILELNVENGQEVVKVINEAGGKANCVACDVSD